MRRHLTLVALLVAVAAPAAGLAHQAGSANRPSSAATRLLVAFAGPFGGGHFGVGLGRRGFSRGGGLFGRRGRSPQFLRHVVHALAFAYFLHLLFSHGAISVLFWLLVIGMVVHLVRRRRRRRYAY